MLLLELSFMHSHPWVTDYKADTLSVQFYFAIKIKGISHKEKMYNCGKILSKSSTEEALFSPKSCSPRGWERI